MANPAQGNKIEYLSHENAISDNRRTDRQLLDIRMPKMRVEPTRHRCLPNLFFGRNAE